MPEAHTRPHRHTTRHRLAKGGSSWRSLPGTRARSEQAASAAMSHRGPRGRGRGTKATLPAWMTNNGVAGALLPLGAPAMPPPAMPPPASAAPPSGAPCSVAFVALALPEPCSVLHVWASGTGASSGGVTPRARCAPQVPTARARQTRRHRRQSRAPGPRATTTIRSRTQTSRTRRRQRRKPRRRARTGTVGTTLTAQAQSRDRTRRRSWRAGESWATLTQTVKCGLPARREHSSR